MPAMEPQGSSKLYIRCFFLKKRFHKAFPRTPSTPDTRAQPTAPHQVQTHPSCKPCTKSEVPRGSLQPDPSPGQDRGDLRKTGAIQQRGKAAVSRKENSWDSFVHSCEALREQKNHVGVGKAATHQENCWQKADFRQHLERGQSQESCSSPRINLSIYRGDVYRQLHLYLTTSPTQECKRQPGAPCPAQWPPDLAFTGEMLLWDLLSYCIRGVLPLLRCSKAWLFHHRCCHDAFSASRKVTGTRGPVIR